MPEGYGRDKRWIVGPAANWRQNPRLWAIPVPKTRQKSSCDMMSPAEIFREA